MFELTEGHFEHVIGLLSVITTNHSDSDSCDDPGTDFNALGVVILDGSEIKWSPKGAERLLDFLNASVCVAGTSNWRLILLKNSVCVYMYVCVHISIYCMYTCVIGLKQNT